MTPTPTTRSSLLFRLRDSQDHEAWVEFVEIYEPVIYRQLRKCGLQDADARELMQEFFIAVSRRIERWELAKERGSFRGWLRRVTRNLVINWMRHGQRRMIAFGGPASQSLFVDIAADGCPESIEFDTELRRSTFQRASESVRQEHGNVVDDTTHRDTWDLLRELVGKPDFLYVADCKLSSQENLAHIAQRGGRFVTVLPASRREDGQFRQRLREQPAAIRWTELYQRTDERDEVCDTLSVHSDEETSSDGYRLLWYHSTRKRELDRTARLRRIERAVQELRELNARLLGPRSRFRQREQVDAAVAAIRNEHDVASLLRVEIHETPRETYKQAQPGRPTSSTKYVRESRASYDLSMEVDMLAVAAAEAGDGVFPLLTNDRSLTAEQVLRAYKRQPLIEKRFSQFKTDFAVAPVYLKNVARVQGLLAAYFLVLLIQTLLERELRLALARTERGTLPLYPEARPCRRPTTRRVLDAFESVQRHVVTLPDGTEQTLVTELSPLQREILQLLRINPTQYGR